MPIESNLASLLERFFVKRLMSERHVSPHTIASYRDTFRLLLQCATVKLKKEPSALVLEDLDSQFISSLFG
jgi:integrase/recombinase XerD